MFVSHQHGHQTHHLELLRWLALLALAAALSLLAASEARGTPVERPTTPAPAPESARDFDALALWQVLQIQRTGEPTEAIAAWQELALPEQSEIWRKIALGVSSLKAGKLADAEAFLLEAKGLDHEHPIVHYFIGSLRLQQAALAHEFYDRPISDVGTQLVSLAVPLPRSLYLIAATMSFDSAIESGATLDESMPLVPIAWTVPSPYGLEMPMTTPTVADWLRAVDADNFVGRAHNRLGTLYLDRGSFASAERHMDQAAELAVDEEIGYVELARQLGLAGHDEDARRVLLKAWKVTGTMPLGEFFEDDLRAVPDVL